MSGENGSSPEFISPAPTPFNFNATKIGRTTDESGVELDLFQITIYSNTGQTVLFATSEELRGIGEMLMQLSTGIVVAHSVDDIER